MNPAFLVVKRLWINRIHRVFVNDVPNSFSVDAITQQNLAVPS
jgi:hypothetical protein